MRRRTFKGDPGNGRVADLRQCPPGQRSRNAGRRGFHQNFNGKNFTSRDHAGHAGDAGSDSRLFLRDRDPHREQTGWRNSHRQGSARLTRDGEGNTGRLLAHPRSLPLWRQHPSERCPDATGKGDRRQLSERELFFLALTVRHAGSQLSSRLSIEMARATKDRSRKRIDVWISVNVGVTSRPSKRATTLNCTTGMSFSSTGGSWRRSLATTSVPLIRRRKRNWPRSAPLMKRILISR